ncbi:TetR/AcrR family transcriptional regulator [Nonomuraea antimicrobica]
MIGRAALTAISRDGPTALRMRALADELGVSPRALYNYVTDQREVLALALGVAQDDAPEPRLDPADWQDSLRGYCQELRAWYRRHAGLVALAMSGQFAALPGPQPTLARHQDAVLEFLLRIGLSPEGALRAYQQMILLIAGFTEFYDSWHDRPPPGWTRPNGTRSLRRSGMPRRVSTRLICAASSPRPAHSTRTNCSAPPWTCWWRGSNGP